MQSHGRLFSSPESPTYSFRIPRLIPQTGTGNVSSSGSVYLSGSTMSGVTYGTGVQTIILTESGASRATATIPL